VAEPGPGDFKESVQLRSDKLVHFACRMTGNGEDARDAVQEALAKAYLVWAQIEQPDAYVHRLVINSVRNSYRARRLEILVADPPDLGVADSGLEAIAARAAWRSSGGSKTAATAPCNQAGRPASVAHHAAGRGRSGGADPRRSVPARSTRRSRPAPGSTTDSQ